MGASDPWRHSDGTAIPEEDRGLRHDLPLLLGRRHLLGLAAGFGALSLLTACAREEPTPSGLVEVPDETAGPFPGDGSNGIDVLDDTGIVRRDIRSSFGASTTLAAGIPLTVRLTVRDLDSSGPLTDPPAAVYLWHCDREGRYSLYTNGLQNENYLRGVQPVDPSGTATFTTIFPGCYRGRWPHLHFEVYRSIEDATRSGPIVKTSQLALPPEACETAYRATGYELSLGNLAGTSLERDGVFRDDGAIHQLATTSGDPAAGYVASLTIGTRG
ncbi:MAG: 3,4-dioxygenase subunit beta [Kineosporiaceae bacterium]|nr:3,4-dioxygenase subunit beta [Kineosporiaceae bacterium]